VSDTSRRLIERKWIIAAGWTPAMIKAFLSAPEVCHERCAGWEWIVHSFNYDEWIGQQNNPLVKAWLAKLSDKRALKQAKLNSKRTLRLIHEMLQDEHDIEQRVTDGWLAEELRRVQAEELRERDKLRAAVLPEIERLKDRIAADPRPNDIRDFFRRWKEVTGYRVTDVLGIRPNLSAIKALIIEQTLMTAKARCWPCGIKRGAFAFSHYSSVVYVDTQYGQVSFHVAQSAYADLPAYAGEWSGQNDSAEILEKVFGDCERKRAA
jgi:hypothetical protein